MFYNNAHMYDLRPPPPGRESITIGYVRKLRVEYLGNIDMVFSRVYGTSGSRSSMFCMSRVLVLTYTAVQRTHLIISDASRTHIMGTCLTFPRSSSGSSARATRLTARSIGGRPRQNSMFANNLRRQLHHPIPPPPRTIPSLSSHCMSSFSGV